MTVPKKFLKPYDPKSVEPQIYKKWEESGYFNPDNLPGERKEPFTIVMPPPNVTGVLHMGHALMLTIEDILIRYKRMRGYKTLWLPGTDHAAIATQAVVEKELSKKEKRSRFYFGREEFLKRVQAFAAQSHDTIVSQIKVMGASCDWSREAFTLDEKRSRSVNTAFKKMYDDGLIYRGNRIVNWDPKGGTTISDDEIVYEERNAVLYTFKYSKDFPFSIATTRPETKLGDTAVAVHPTDERYQKYIGQTFATPFAGTNLTLTVVADESVDPSFGTGALGVTPAHSQQDWDIAQKNKLPVLQIIDERARITKEGGELAGKKVLEAREAVVQWLRDNNLLEKEEAIKQNVATAERTGGIVEPLPKLQWWVDVEKPIAARGGKTLKDLMRKPVADDSIKILPDHFQKIYFHWIDNLRPWCISRQIWYGHRIPVWYQGDKIAVGEAPQGSGWQQDEDTLDTWFSSALWTFSTLGWPDKTNDLEVFHPTDVLETGYEILFFWIARMILMSQYILGEVPFRTVYLHGTVRDQKGRKMSKSLGNGIDPMDVAREFGTDAGRMALVVGNTPGTDSRISNDKIKAYKLFANKVWNITRFVLSQERRGQLMPELVKEFDALARDVTEDLENYRIYLAAEKIYHYLWDRFAAQLIEESKGKPEYAETLHYILEQSLKLLHPFMPFLTEEIWASLPGKSGLIMVEKWPEHSS